MAMEYIETSEFVCIYCGKPLSALEDRRKNRQLYCDSRCQKKYIRATTPEERQRNREIIKSSRFEPEKHCKFCGEAFSSPVWQNRQYCSPSCYHKGKSAEAFQSYPEKKCEYCGETFRYPAQQKRIYCSALCSRKARAEYFTAVQTEKAREASPWLMAFLTADEFVCIYCGKALENGAKTSKLYCDKNCERNYYRVTTPEMRFENRKILEAGRLRKNTREIKCAYCSETFTAIAHKNRQYCSHACHNKAESERFAAIAAEELAKVTARINDTQTLAEAVCIYCGEPLGKEKQLYCSPKCKRRYCTITGLDERHKNRETIEKFRLHPEKKCAYCGKMFTSLAYENQVYCGVACKNKAQSEYWADIAEKKACETAERLHRVLTHGESICIYCGEQLSNKNGGRLFCGKKCLTAFHNRRNPYQLTPKKIVKMVVNPESKCDYCENAEEWLRVLRDEIQLSDFAYAGTIPDGKPVRLICESVRIDKSVHSFAAIVHSKGLDPFDGGCYAFCGLMRNRIRYIWWSNYGFQMSLWERYYGSFVWPNENWEEVVTLTAEEFEFVLKGSRPPRFPNKIIV